MRNKRKFFSAVLAGGVFLPVSMLAQDQSFSPIFEVGVGSTYITADEILWNVPAGGSDADEMISLLEWTTYWTPTVSLGAKFQLNDSLSLNVSGVVADSFLGDSYMVDYDWLNGTSNPKSSWTDRSKHEDTVLDYYYTLDANLSYDINMNSGLTRLSPSLGVNYTRLRWTAYGGSYVYSSYDPFTGDVGNRDLRGDFPDESAGISYRMEYLSPYFGLNLAHRWEDYNFAIGGKLGTTIDAEAYDYHYARNIRFVDSLDDTLYTSVDLSVEKQISSQFSFLAGLSWTGYEQTDGDLTLYDDDFNTREEFAETSGASLQTLTFTVGASYKF